jgi:integrase/recombinase XerD
LYNTLVELSKEKKMYFSQPKAYVQYIPPKLTKGKVWYVSYYVQNPETGKLKRYRIKLDRYHSQKERLAAARNISADLEEKLALGWNPMLESKAPKAYSRIFKVFDSFLAVKDRELESNSLRSYHSYVKIIKQWLLDHGQNEEMPAASFTERVALSFLDEIEETKSPRTYNNYITFYRTLFDWMMDKGYISVNPFGRLKKKPKRLTKKIRRMVTKDELSRIFGFLSKDNPEYLAMVMLCYCCFLRPKELAMLRCQDVNLQRQTIHVAAKIAKNDNESYRTIPDEIMPILRKLDYRHPDWYLFGANAKASDYRPSAKQKCSRDIARFWNNRVRAECQLPMAVQFYSLKDTGITNMLNNGVPINLVQKQADHSSVAITSIYIGQNSQADSKIKAADVLNQNETIPSK